MKEKVEALLEKKWPGCQVKVGVDPRNIVTLEGSVKDWQTVVDMGHGVAKLKGVKNVVNELTVPGLHIPKKDYGALSSAGRSRGEVDKADVIIIGGGVSGCGIARTLAQYDLDVLVLEQNDDVCTGASKANNGNIHAGHAAKPGTLKAKLNVEGNRMYTQWAEELGFELQRCGAMGVITKYTHLPLLLGAYAIARKNGVDGVKIIGKKGVFQREPKLRGPKVAVKAGLWLPSMGLVEPYEVVVALAENAAENGVRFRFRTTVGEVLHENGQVQGVITNQGIIKAPYVINCAGVYADEISAMAGDKSYTIHARRGTIAILDKNAQPEFDCLCEIVDPKALMKKNKDSKGGGMCRTPEHNILLGPSATETPDKEDTRTTPEDLAYAMGRNQNKNVSYGNIIRIFAGARPADYKEDFVIEMSPITHGFINCGAIQSPGLAAAPAVATMVRDILAADKAAQNAPLRPRAGYNPIHHGKKNFRRMTHEEQDALIGENPAYGRIICRCESITEGEILDAIHSPIVPTSIDAIKRRTRAGMGRCQGGFCQPRVLELLARELGEDWVHINLNEEDTNVLLASTRP